jgi:hypothetical protein
MTGGKGMEKPAVIADGRPFLIVQQVAAVVRRNTYRM